MSKLATTPQCSWVTMAMNSLLCFVCAVFVFVYFRKIFYIYPVTVETIFQIALAEVNRQRSKRRVRVLETPKDAEWGLKEKQLHIRYMASVVGYREDVTIFKKCMESYRDSPGLKVLLVGIDGNQIPDMDMANVVRNVHAKNVTFIPLLEPLGVLASRIAKDYAFEMFEKSQEKFTFLNELLDFDILSDSIKKESRQHALKQVLNRAVSILEKNSALRSSSDALRVICITQPHVCKKEVMFTNMIFSLALSQATDIEYLWTSDSDTYIQPSTIPRTIGCMSMDSHVGGSCSSLSIHNEDASTIAALGSAAYWSELALTRGFSASVDAADCQPGPCAAFKLEALEPILMDWYTQTSLGIKTVVNEDRHLTTRLLLDSWKVTFNTEALASTDTPVTLIRWLLQQLRWARATHIETFQYPQVYSLHGPIPFVAAMRRFYGPLIIAIATIRYVLRGDVIYAYSLYDLFYRVLLCTAYNWLTNSQHVKSWAILAASQVFYQVPLPAIIFWSTVTVLESNWGTQMRSKKEAQKEVRAGWENMGAVLVVTGWMGFVSAAMARFLCNKIAPDLLVISMTVSAACMCSLLLWGLLGKAKKI